MIDEKKEIVDVLLKYNAKPNNKNKDGDTPLYTAMIDDNKEIVDVLLKYKANPNTPSRGGVTPLHMAVYNQNFEIVSQLLTANADPNIIDLEGLSPCIIQTSPEVKQLLTHRCDNVVLNQNIDSSVV